MESYHKIQSIYKRDPETNYKTFLSEYSRPEIGYLADLDWYWTEKVDGMNIRIRWIRDFRDLDIRGRSDNAQIPGNLLEHLIGLVHVSQFDSQFADCEQVCIYGEGYGGKIQKAGETYGPDQRFVMFDVKVGDVWLDRSSVLDIADSLEIESVPIVGHGTLLEAENFVRKLPVSNWGAFQAEGIVARPKVELQNKMGERIIVKLKCCDFYEEERQAGKG